MHILHTLKNKYPAVHTPLRSSCHIHYKFTPTTYRPHKCSTQIYYQCWIWCRGEKKHFSTFEILWKKVRFRKYHNSARVDIYFIRSKISTSNFSEIMPLEVYSIDAVSACEPVFRQGNLNISNTIRTPCKIINWGISQLYFVKNLINSPLTA